jgi:UDP-glucose 4-epimerase
MKILVTGGAGYIGSTICSALKDKGHTPIILDSLVTGRREFTKEHLFYEGDISDSELLKKIVDENPEIKVLIHCAARIVVPESVENPYMYYKENVSKSIELYKNMETLGIENIVFSSSASIYDDADDFMVKENSNLNPRSPYARTKYMMEMILEDFCKAYKLRGLALRYFNPIGADPKLRTGAHIEAPSHVLGKMMEAAKNEDVIFNVTGTNWPTRDGSGIRDYIHIWDLAQAHVLAVEKIESILDCEVNNYDVINLGTSRGVTVKELLEAFDEVFGRNIKRNETEPRPGDVAGAYANAEYAFKKLNWKANKTVKEGIEDALRWEKERDNIIPRYK